MKLKRKERVRLKLKNNPTSATEKEYWRIRFSVKKVLKAAYNSDIKQMENKLDRNLREF